MEEDSNSGPSNKKESTCEHCGWTGKHILQHMRHNKSYMEKTDMDELRHRIKEIHRGEKRKYQANYNKEHKEEKRGYYKEHKKEKREYQAKYDEETLKSLPSNNGEMLTKLELYSIRM